jgi:hypothetical protein
MLSACTSCIRTSLNALSAAFDAQLLGALEGSAREAADVDDVAASTAPQVQRVLAR